MRSEIREVHYSKEDYQNKAILDFKGKFGLGLCGTWLATRESNLLTYSQFGEESFRCRQAAPIGACRHFSSSSHHCLTDRRNRRRNRPHLKWWLISLHPCLCIVGSERRGRVCRRSRGAIRVLPRLSRELAKFAVAWDRWSYCSWSTYVRVAVHLAAAFDLASFAGGC